jgi:CheY-specific phosphatase CheX
MRGPKGEQNMQTFRFFSVHRMSFALVVLLAASILAVAQTSAFTYQGRFTDTAAAQPTNGTYNMQFVLFGSVNGSDQIGSVITNPAVQVTNGVFTTDLDFTAASFPAGAARYLEIRVFNVTASAYVTLTPRQQLTSSPFSIRALSATAADDLSSLCVGCVTDSKLATGIDGAKITGTVGNAQNAVNATTAGTATNFSGNLTGDVGGTQGATVIQPNSVTAAKIASNQVVKSVNGLKDAVTLAGSSTITITPAGNTLTIATASPLIKKAAVQFPLAAPANVTYTHGLATADIQVAVYKQNGTDWNYVPFAAGALVLIVLDTNTVRVAIFDTGTFKIVVIG